ncbi:MAG: DNA polymerase III subunit delta [Patescibacteria group bacterium]|nr:DNA polymerase III subunit delta [Patescibacteria group bacterium]
MIFFLYGPDSFRRRQKLNELKERFMSTVDALGQSLIVLDGSQTTPQILQEKISSGSLFTKKRMVVIENIFLNKNEAVFTSLLNICNKNASANDNAIVFSEAEIVVSKLKAEAKKLNNLLKKQPFVQEFALLSGNNLLAFAQKEIQKQKGSIATQALSLLCHRVGNDLWRLNNEIAKLTACAGEKIIDQALVEEMVKSEADDNIFALTDALGAKNIKLALQLLEEQFAAGLSAEYILVMFQRQFKIMLEIKVAQNQGTTNETQIASKLKLHPFVVKKTASQSNKFSLEELNQYWDELLNLDFRNKQGRADIKSELYALIAGLV